MKLGVIAVAITSMALSGCVAPLVKLNPMAMQYKVGHARDWQSLAHRSALAFKATQSAIPPRLYIAPGPSDMPFANTYRRFLEAELMKMGYSIVDSSAGSIVLNFDVQTFWYGSQSGNQKQLIEYASLYSTLGAGGAEVRHMHSPETLIFDGLVAGPIIDLLASFNATTRSEVVLTLSVVGDDRPHFLSSETFYVRPSDLPLYWSKMPAGSPQSLKTTTLAVVPLPVVASGAYR